jgi:hypothetical protein
MINSFREETEVATVGSLRKFLEGIPEDAQLFISKDPAADAEGMVTAFFWMTDKGDMEVIFK